jgi:O-antigen/teichoic acid export membrane protein
MKTKSETPASKLIVKNLGFLYNGEIISQLLTLVLIIVISRQLGDVGLGKYSFAFSFAALFLLLADFGLPTLITKEVAKNKSLAKDHLSKTLTLKFILNALTLLITLIVIFISRKDFETILLVLLAGIAMFFYNFGGIFRSIVQAYESMKYEVISKAIERTIAAAVGIYLLLNGYGIVSLFLTLIISNFVYSIILYFFVSRKISKTGISFDTGYWKQTVKKSFPFWLTLIFISFYARIDTVMLGFMTDYATTGWYNAAYRIIDVFIRILFLPIIAIFPALSKFHGVSLSKTKLLYEKSFYYMLVLSVPIVTGLIFLSQKIILTIYGNQFINSVIALQILGFALFFTSMNFLMGYLLNSIDKQKLFTITTGTATVVNILLNLILIPLYSYIGAAIATVVSEILNFGMLYYFTKKSNFSINILKLITKPLIAGIIMLIGLYYLTGLSIIILPIIGAIIYFSVLFIIKGLGKEEIDLVKSFISK